MTDEDDNILQQIGFIAQGIIANTGYVLDMGQEELTIAEFKLLITHNKCLKIITMIANRGDQK